MIQQNSNKQTPLQSLPPVLAGPILRRATGTQLTLWLVGSAALCLRLKVTSANNLCIDRTLSDDDLHVLRFGEHAYLYLIDITFPQALPTDCRIDYDLAIAEANADANAAADSPWRWLADWAPHLCLPQAACPSYVVKSRLDRILHGSCRRPHHWASDGLVRVDEELLACGDDTSQRPALLLMTGDQIYADDVAGPMLRTIHALIQRLGLYDETLSGSTVADSQALRQSPHTYYGRQHLLPDDERNEDLLRRFFGGVKKPIFTTDSPHNHLISLAEVMAMYLLVWSPACWRLLQVTPPTLAEADAALYQREQQCLDRFVAGLPRAARALAHLPTYMIFDDHDITDDWNLSALWEATTYEHPFSRRIVGNALIGYLLCQGWGNCPEAFAEFLPAVKTLLNKPALSTYLRDDAHNALVYRLLEFQHWHYTLPTSPKLVVLDTRTRRWRSEKSLGRPSGLMDWEALSEFQQTIMGEQSVIVVSPAPMFGVKLIESIQRIFTLLRRPLMVDAENWMAHPGSAHVLLHIFGHSGTPQNFVILSGDVHYSFAYDVRLRHKRNGPKIWQITSSGIKNQFPEALLEWLDRANRWLFAPQSPLNWFTKRGRMRITPREPTGRQRGERLWNGAGIGLLVLDEQGRPVEIKQLDADGGGTEFLVGE